MHRIVEPTRLPALAFISSQLAPKSMASWRSISLNKGSLEFSSRLKTFLQKMNKNHAILLSYATGRLERILLIHLTTAHFRPGEWLSPTNPTVAKANPWLTPSSKLTDGPQNIHLWLGRELHGAYHVIIGSKCLVKTNTGRSNIFVLHLMWPRENTSYAPQDPEWPPHHQSD